MQLSLITAFDKNQLIGNGNALPWNIPEDLAYFKKLTSGNTIVMGRKTYESIGRPLPNRRNIILSRNISSSPDVEVFNDYQQILQLSVNEPIFVIGGSEIYRLFLPFANALYITYIDDEFQGDTYFPPINFDNWVKYSERLGQANNIRFCHYIRKA